MGCCGTCFRYFIYIMGAVAAILGYFHLECVKEKEYEDFMKKQQQTCEFNPLLTEVETTFNFSAKGDIDQELFIGPEYILKAFAPCALVKLFSYSWYAIHKATSNKPVYNGETKLQNVTIYDARKTSFGDFHESGFTLIKLQEETTTQDWRSMIQQNATADITNFHKQFEPYLLKLYPQTKRFLWTSNVIRGGDMAGSQPPAISAPHLDYHQNDTLRAIFHKTDPAFPNSEADILLGKKDNEDSKLAVMLGVWKPLYPDTICDHPLAVMDARSFSEENLLPLKLHINFLVANINNLNGAITYNPEQKWAYYPFQSKDEVLVFHQYTKGRFFANPHTSFLNKNCPKDHGSRMSVELRVGLYF